MSIKLSKSNKDIVFEKTNGRCAYCDQIPKTTWDTCLDHMEPKSYGGSDRVENLIISCRKCNLMKSDFYMDDFLSRTLKKLTEAVQKSINHNNRVQTMIRRHGHDLEVDKLLADQFPLNVEVRTLSTMVGNIIKWL